MRRFRRRSQGEGPKDYRKGPHVDETDDRYELVNSFIRDRAGSTDETQILWEFILGVSDTAFDEGLDHLLRSYRPEGEDDFFEPEDEEEDDFLESEDEEEDYSDLFELEND